MHVAILHWAPTSARRAAGGSRLDWTGLDRAGQAGGRAIHVVCRLSVTAQRPLPTSVGRQSIPVGGRADVDGGSHTL